MEDMAEVEREAEEAVVMVCDVHLYYIDCFLTQ